MEGRPAVSRGPAIVISTSLPVSRVLSTRRNAIDGHSSGTRLTARLMQPTRMIKPGNGPGANACVIPIRFCSRWGLPCRPCYQRRGALLPHPFTLTSRMRGGLLSVALSLGSPPPDVIRHRASMEPGLSSPHEGTKYTFLAAERPSGQLASTE